MKILFFRHTLLSRGGDKMVVCHANYLVHAGHDVIIMTSRCDTVFHVDKRVRIEYLSTKSKAATLLKAAVTRYDADLVIGDIVVLACLLSLRNLSKTVCFAQDYDESYYTNKVQKLFIRLVYFITMTMFRVKTVAVSDRLAQLLRSRFRADVSVVQNGVDATVFFPEVGHEYLQNKGERQAILLLSRSDQRKGFDLAQRIVNSFPDDMRSETEIWTVGEANNNLFPGFIHRDFGYVDEVTLRRILSSADMLLYPSRHEGLPLMPLEAFACRCPVVTTAAVPYAIDGENSLVSQIESVDDLAVNTRRLMNDKALRTHIVENAHRYAVENSLSACTANFASVLERMFSLI